MNHKLLFLAVVIIAASVTDVSLKAQSTNLIDFQIGATPYSIYNYTNTSGAAVLGGTNDVWNQLVGTWSSSSGSTIVYATNLFYTSASTNFSSVTLSVVGNAYSAVGALPAGASPAFTATNGAPVTNASGTPTPNLPALYSAGTTTLYYHDGGGLSDVSFSFSNLSNYIGDNFILEMYTASTVNTSLSGGVNGGNTGNALIATGADQNINRGSGDAYVQYSGTITGNGFTFDASNYGLWNTALVGGQLQLITPPSVTSYLWSNAPVDGNWANGVNWAGSFGPTNGNGVQLNFATSSITNLTNNFVNASFGSVNFATNANAYTINGNGFALYSGLTNSSFRNQVINDAISGPGIVHAIGSGTLILNGVNHYTGNTTVEAGASIFLNGSLSNSLIVNSGAFTEPSNGTITGGAGFNQIGTGTATLAGNNSFQGQLMINAGKVILSGNNINRPGGTNFSTSLTGGTLQLQAAPANTVGGVSHALSAEASAGGAPFAFENAILQLRSDTPVTFAGGNNLSVLTLNTSINFDVDQLTPGHSNNTITFAPGGFQIVNTTINVTGSNAGYTLALGNLSGFQNNDGLNLNANGANLQVGAVTNNSFLNVGGKGNTTISGTINGFGGPGNSDPLTKNGTGTLTLSGNNTYTGVTYVNAGTLVVNNTSGSATGTQAGQNAVYIYSGATLGGNGTIGCPVEVDGNLTPSIAGNGSSLLTVGNLTFGSTATTTLTLLSNGIAGVNYDTILVTNGLNYNGSLDLVMNSIALGTFHLFGAGSYNGDFTNVSLMGAYTNASFSDSSGIWTYTNSAYSWLFNTQSGNLTVSQLSTASYLWSNAPVDGNLANGANWAGSFGPSINSQLLFGPTSIATVTNNFSGGSFSGLSFTTNASAYTVNGNPISIGYQGITNTSFNIEVINAPISGSGGITEAGTGTLILTPGTTNSYTGGNIINANATLEGDTTSIQGAVQDNGNLIYMLTTNGTASAINGSGSVTLNGTGTLTVNGNNSYSGGTVLNGPSLSINFNNAINPLGSGTVTFATNGTILCNSTNVTFGNAFVVSNGASATFNAGILSTTTHETEFSLNGGISGPGSVTYVATQTNWITLNIVNETYTGGTTLGGGIVQWLGTRPSGQGGGVSTPFGSGPITVVANSTMRDIYDVNISNSTYVASGVTLTLSNTLTSNNYTYSAGISGPGSLAIGNFGGASIMLAGNNTFTGSTLITSGTLILSGSISGTTNINLGTLASQGTLSSPGAPFFNLGTNQTLSGYGIINIGSGASQLTINGHLKPGSIDGTSRGLITSTGKLSLASNAVTTLTLITNGIAGTDYDAVNVDYNMAFGGALDLLVNNIPSAGTYDLFSAPSFSGDFKSVGLYGTWNLGSFTENTPDLWTYSDPTYQWMFNAANGQLTVSPVPEPSTCALLGLGVLALMLAIRRKIRS